MSEPAHAIPINPCPLRHLLNILKSVPNLTYARCFAHAIVRSTRTCSLDVDQDVTDARHSTALRPHDADAMVAFTHPALPAHTQALSQRAFDAFLEGTVISITHFAGD